MKLKNDTFLLNEDTQGFYKSTIKAGTVLHCYNTIDKPTRHNGESHYRFVFDTIKGASGHNSPIGNKRTSIWYTKVKGFDTSISPIAS